jgi:hypothetical protein
MCLKPLLDKIGPCQLKEGSSVDVWQKKVRRFRKWSKGWSKNIESELLNLKKYLMKEYNALDIKAKTKRVVSSRTYKVKKIFMLKCITSGWMSKSKPSRGLEMGIIKKVIEILHIFIVLQIREEGKCLFTLLMDLMGSSHMMPKCLTWQHPSIETF